MPGHVSQLLHTPSRIIAVAGVTLTQLVRMRLFAVLAVFAVGFLGLQFLPYQGNLGVTYQGIGQLQLIKDIAMGCMRLFSMLFCVAATSLLIPRDSEDRILYTILCKPVPRFDYLAGKALGVLALLAVMLVIMDGMMVSILSVREGSIAIELREMLAAQGFHHEEEIAPYMQQLAEAGNTLDVQRSLLAMFLGYGVLTTFTLLMSCVTSGTIVSMVFAMGVYFIGMFQNLLYSTISAGGYGTGVVMQWVERCVAVIVPDFSLYSVSDAAAAGAVVSWSLLGELALIAAGYMLLHLLVATWIFSRKEF